MEKLGSIILNETKINLDTSSIDFLKDQLEKINEKEQIVKQELNSILKELD